MSTRFTDRPSIVGTDITETRLRRVEEQLLSIENRLLNGYIIGRLRIDRPAPANSADWNTTDKLYDIVRDTNYEYVLIDDAGTLAWRRISYSAF